MWRKWEGDAAKNIALERTREIAFDAEITFLNSTIHSRLSTIITMGIEH